MFVLWPTLWDPWTDGLIRRMFWLTLEWAVLFRECSAYQWLAYECGDDLDWVGGGSLHHPWWHV